MEYRILGSDFVSQLGVFVPSGSRSSVGFIKNRKTWRPRLRPTDPQESLARESALVICSWLIILPKKFESPCGGSHEGGERVWNEPCTGDLEPPSRTRQNFFWAIVLRAKIEFSCAPFNLLPVLIGLVSYLLLAPGRSLLICPADFLLSFLGLALHLEATCFLSNPSLPCGFRFLVTLVRVAGQLPEQGRNGRRAGIQNPCAANEEHTAHGAT